MQSCECGSDEVWLLTCVQHKEAELMNEAELCVQGLLEIICLSLQHAEESSLVI